MSEEIKEKARRSWLKFALIMPTNAGKPCYPRKQFATQAQAMTACARIANTQKILRYAVPCSHCNKWHLS